MSSLWSRRAVLAGALTAVTGGCLASGERGTSTATDATGGGKAASSTPSPTPSSTPSPTPSSTPSPEELASRLPKRSPLADPLVELLLADDRTRAADRLGLDYRPADDSVRVAIELEPDGELPDGYRIEVLSRYGGQIIAYVHVLDLVPLAMATGVRKVTEPPESRTGDPGTPASTAGG